MQAGPSCTTSPAKHSCLPISDVRARNRLARNPRGSSAQIQIAQVHTELQPSNPTKSNLDCQANAHPRQHQPTIGPGSLTFPCASSHTLTRSSLKSHVPMLSCSITCGPQSLVLFSTTRILQAQIYTCMLMGRPPSSRVSNARASASLFPTSSGQWVLALLGGAACMRSVSGLNSAFG